MSLNSSTQFETSDAAQNFSTIGNRLVQLDALLDAIRIVESPMVAADGLYAGQVEELIDIAKQLLREADTAFCNYNERQSKSMDAGTVTTQVSKVLKP